MKSCSNLFRALLVPAVVALALGSAPLHAAWTSDNLPSLSTTFGSYRMDQLSDGSLVYGANDSLSREASFGSFPLQSFTTHGSWDPSAVAVYSANLGAIGQGTFSASQIFTFNPSNLATPYTAIPSVSIQNYSLLFRDSTSLYVGGGNGTDPNGFGSFKHSISYVALDGTNKVIIDNVSTYSADFAMNGVGDLFVANNDDLKLYKFTASQLSTAITGTALTIADGLLLTTLEGDGSLAVDSLGRIWSTGYQFNGLDMFDPSSQVTTRFLPALDNNNYVVDTFSASGENYVGFINASGPSIGSSLTYGHDIVAHLVPEPTSLALLGISASLLALRRRRGLRL